MKKINDCEDCKKTYAIFCSSRCQRNYMQRRKYHANKNRDLDVLRFIKKELEDINGK